MVRKTDTPPSEWSPAVIRALCTRLPGGRKCATTLCDDCGSRFYPCLCAESRARVPHAREFRPPRILHEAEVDRLQHGFCRGNLKIVTRMTTQHGVITDKYFHLDPGSSGSVWSKRDRASADSACGSVLCRSAERYLVQPDGAEPWVQALALSHAELRALLHATSDDLTVRSVVTPAIREAVCRYGSEEEARGDLELLWMHEEFLVCCLKPDGIAYRCGIRKGQLLRKLRFERVVVGRGKPVFEDADLCEVPWALRCVCASECEGAGKESEGNWPCELRFDVLPAGWRAVQELDSNGSRAELLSRDRLAGLVDAGSGARIVVECSALEVVERDGTRLRHQHVWEQDLPLGRELKHEMLQAWLIRSRLTTAQASFMLKRMNAILGKEVADFDGKRAKYETFIHAKCRRCVEIQAGIREVTRHETQAHLKKEFRNAVNEIQQLCQEVPIFFLMELRDMGVEFRRFRLVPSRPPGESASSALELRLYHSGQPPAEEPEECVRGEHGSHELRFRRQVLVNSFSFSGPRAESWQLEASIDGAEPYTLLHEIAAEEVPQSGPWELLPDGELREHAWRLPLLPEHLGAKSELPRLASSPPMSPSAASPMRRSHSAVSLATIDARLERSQSTTSVSSFRGLGPRSDKRTRPVASVPEDEVLLCVAEQAGQYLRDLHDRPAPRVGIKASMARAGKKAAVKETSFCSDGRMSHDDFKALLWRLGMTWLTDEDSHAMFDAIDVDRSNQLNLGEVLIAVERLNEIIRKVRAYLDSVRASGRIVAEREALQEYAEQMFRQ